MTEMPLFPLNTVLFPGMPLNLHIFEDRYKLMINRCMDEQIPFGVVLISSGSEAMGPLAEPYQVGCTAKITQVKPLAQGRMNLVAVGDQRFRIVELDAQTHPYLSAYVEIDSLQTLNEATLTQAGEALYPMVTKYLEILAQIGDVQFNPDQLPQDALGLANLAAYLIRVDNDVKQDLLEAPDATTFVQMVRSLFKRENALLESMMSAGDHLDNVGPFSLN